MTKDYRIYSRNSRTFFLTKILYLNLGCVIYARKRFYVNKSGYTRNFLKCIKSVNYASKYGISPSLQRTAINDRWTSNIGWDPLLQTKALDSQRYLEARGGMAEWPCQRTRNLISRVDKRINKWVIKGTAVGTAVKVLCYKSEGRWFDPCWCR